MQASNEEYVV